MVLSRIVAILVCMRDVDLIEKLTGFVRSLYERIRDWEFRHPRIARPFWYFIILVFVLGVCYWAFNYLDLYHTDADSARYMLSAMVQAQAAIVAIVITLTLVAVQLTASVYSPRVIDIFKKNPDMWLLLGFYGLSMLYGFVVLKMVEGVGGEVVSQDIIWSFEGVSVSFEGLVSLAYWLEVFTLVALVPYMRNTIDLLKPENIINRLAIENSIQPIMDIIHSSVMKYDIATTRIGLKAVTDQMIRIVGLDVQKVISRHPITFEQLDIVVIDPDEDSTGEVIEKTDRGERLGDAASQAVESIIDSCFFDHFTRVARLTVSKMDEEATGEVIKNLYNFGKLTAENGLEYATSQAVESLGFIGKLTAEKGKEFEDVTKQAAWSLGRVGQTAAKNELEDATSQAAESLGYVGTTAAEKGPEDVTWYVARRLRVVGQTAAKSGLPDATSIVIEFLGDVGTSAAKNGLEYATSEAAWFIRVVGTTAAEKGFRDAAEQATKSLRDIGGIAAKKGLVDATKQAARSLGAIGTTATEKELNFTASGAARFLAELTISNKEIVKTAIQELKQEEPDHDSLQKFMKLYKQRLEKLRTQKPDRPPRK